MSADKHLNIGSLNCQGLKGKYELPEFTGEVSEHDLFGVSEIWLENSDVQNINIPGYKFYPFCRKKEKGPTKGGVGVFVKEEKRRGIKILYDISNEYCLWCKLDRSYYNFDEDVYIGFTYIPPMESSREKRNNLDHFKMLNKKYIDINNDHIILIGDFNARTKNYDDTVSNDGMEILDMEASGIKASRVVPRRNNQDQKANKYGKKLTDFCIATDSYILNGRTLGDIQGKYTCYQPGGTSTVDYAIVNESLMDHVETFQVKPPNISDHCSLRLRIKVPEKVSPEENNLVEMTPPLRWNERTKQVFTDLVSSISTQAKVQKIEKTLEDEENSCIDKAINELNEIFTLKGLWNKKKKRRPRKDSKKWYDYTCLEMGKRLKLVGKLCEKDPKNPYLRGRLVTTRKEYKKLIKHKKHQWKESMIRRLEEIEDKNPTEYWKLIKELKDRKVEQRIINPEEFEDFFKRLFAADNTPTDISGKRGEISSKVAELMRNPGEISQKDYSFEEMKNAISKLKANRSSALVPAEMLKASPEYLLKVLLMICNRIKKSCYFPHEWAKGITTLLHKDGDDNDPNNYRFITVADALSKVMTIMMNERIITKLTQEKIIKCQQIGFIKKARPADHLFVLKNVFEKYLCQGKKVYACFVDFQKAYDNVWRDGLYFKLIKSGIDIHTVKLIKDMYDKTSQTIKMNKKVTKPLKTYKGVRQGCVLSPILFNIFINDLPDIFDDSCKPVLNGNEKLSCLMFADDIVLLSESKDGLQNSLRKLELYAQEWDMKVNQKKTKIMVIQSRGKIPTINIEYEGQTLEVVKSYKYLGTMVSRTGTFKLNDVYLKNKGLKARYAITRSIGIDCKVSTLIRLFERMVEPILLYNCEVAQACIPSTWNLDKFRDKMWEDREMDKVVKGFLRQILGINKKTTIRGIRAETGKFPLSLNIYVQMVKYWTRLLTTESKLMQGAHMDNLERFHEGKQCWIHPLIYLLKTCGINQIDVIEIISKSISFTKHIKEKLIEQYKESWKKEMEEGKEGKLQFYHELKRNFKCEEYLDTISRADRKAITRLRLSCHTLPIERMRYQMVDRQERKCPFCRSEIGDEWHYLTKCNNKDIKNVRSEFVARVKSIQPQLINFNISDLMKYCVSMQDTSVQVETAHFANELLSSYADAVEEDEGKCSIM